MNIKRDKIGSYVEKSPAPRLQGSTNVAIAMDMMNVYDTDIIAVECKEDFVGVFTRDCFTHNVMRYNLIPADTILYEVMLDKPPTIDADHTIKEAYDMMLSYQWDYLPVLRERTLCGIISLRVLAKAIMRPFEDIRIENEAILHYIQYSEVFAMPDYIYPPHSTKTYH